MLPAYLEPWAEILTGSWPADAGPLPDENAVIQAKQLGATPGKKYGLAWIMFSRPNGASRTEIIAACGKPQFNAARQAQKAGKLDFMITERAGRGNVYYIGPPGSKPGGPDVAPVGDANSGDMEEPTDTSQLETPSFPQNLILYGPPGTGKTFATVELVLEIFDRAYLGSDAYIYDECIENGCALLGYGGDTDFSGCKSRDDVFERFISVGKNVAKESYAVTAVSNFLLKIKLGDILIISDGNSKFRAIGEVSGHYQHLVREVEGDDKYGQSRAVKWLRVYSPSLPLERLMHNQFSQMTLYELKPSAIDMEKLAGLLNSSIASVPSASSHSTFAKGEKFGNYEVIYASPDIVELTKPNGKRLPIGMTIIKELADSVRSGKLTLADIKERNVFKKLPETLLDPFLVGGFDNILPPLVERLLKGPSGPTGKAAKSKESPKALIIDEINRGNVSRIFGELITLIEPSKRAGASEALEVTLPYSKKRFSVPDNLYIIGTMNTADRSLTGLDIALRRRFVFREMLPKPELLADTEVQGIDIGQLLSTMNDRIEALLDRDHRLGHAYFLQLLEDPSLDCLSLIFRQQIIPLLQEYFFEDWSRIQLVLNDHRKSPANRFLQQPKTDLASLFGEQSSVSDRNERWIINDDAFSRVEAYLGIIDHQMPALAVEDERQVMHGDLTIKQLTSGSIEVWKNGERLDTAKPTLRIIAKELGLETNYPSGVSLNTRHLGRRVIDAIGKLQT